MNSIVKVNQLFSDTHYAVCMFNSQQNDGFSINQCLGVWTKSEQFTSSSQPQHSTGLVFTLGIVIEGVLMLVVCLDVVSIVIWKKIKSVPSETPRPYATADPYLVSERYVQNISEPFCFRSTLAPGH